jgi:hypothetical protein
MPAFECALEGDLSSTPHRSTRKTAVRNRSARCAFEQELSSAQNERGNTCQGYTHPQAATAAQEYIPDYGASRKSESELKKVKH